MLHTARVSQSSYDAPQAQNQQLQQQNHLLVNSYTDNAPIGQGPQDQGVASNELLSQKRAESVMQFLISKGMNPALLEAKGFGDANPVPSNDTAQGRAKNRRGELTLNPS